MPIVIVPTKKGMQDIDRSTFKDSGYDVDKELAKKKKKKKVDYKGHGGKISKHYKGGGYVITGRD